MPRGERPLDAGDSTLLRFAADLRLLRKKAGNPTYRQLARSAHYSPATLSEAAGGRKVPSLAVTLAYVRACGGDEAEWERRWHELSEESAESAPRTADGPSPYLGLSPFRTEDALLFFGREQAVDGLLTRLGDQRIVMLFGASGAGKSSLLQAGLVARVQAGERPWDTVVFTPGAEPMEECAVHLAPLVGSTAGAVRAELAADRRGLHRLVRQALVERPAETELLIVVDQFEEVFTLCRDEEERARFVESLVTAAQAEGSRCRLVVGVRADFYTHCTLEPGLLRVLPEAQVPLGPMTSDELRQAVIKPAAGMDCMVEGALVSRVAADAAQQAGVLPLVSHVLLETWYRRRGSTLTLAGYESAGGLAGAVAKTAEDAYTRLAPEHQRLARQLFLRLIVVGEGTQDTKRRVHHRRLDGGDDGMAAVLEHLAGSRLITLDHDTVEIAHEALISSWPRLRDWLAEDREGLRTHHRLTEAADTWESLRHDPGSLYRGTRLAAAQEWAERNEKALSGREREFLDASLAARAHEETLARRRTRRLRQLVAALSVLLLVTGTATGYALHAGSEAAEQRNIALSQKVAEHAITMRAVNPPLAAQLSLAAHRLAPTFESRGSLLSAFTSPFTTRLDHEINTVAFTRDGRTIATGGDDRTVRLWDLTARPPAVTAAIPQLSGEVESLRFIHDGRILAGAFYDGTVRLWDTSDRRAPGPLATLTASAKPLFTVAFTTDEQTMATAGEDGTVRLWDLTAPRAPRPLSSFTAHPATIWTAAFDPAGRLLVTAGDDGTAGVWDVTDPARHTLRSRLPHKNSRVMSAAFSPDGRTVATAGWDHVTRLWNVTDPARPAESGRLRGHTGPLQTVAFSPDGRTVATAGWDHTVRVWDVSVPGAPVAVTTLTAHTNTVWSLTFSPDGRTLASASSDRTALLTDLPGPILTGGAAALSTAAFSPDGRTVAAGGEDFAARLWDVTDPYHPQALPVLTGHKGQVKSVAFSPGGDLLATGGIDGAVRLWRTSEPSRPALLAEIDAHVEGIRSVAFHPLGGLVASASPSDNVVRLWDVRDPRRPRSAGALPPQGSGTLALAFAPDGRTLATTQEKAVVLWDVTDPGRPTPLARAEGHTDHVQGVAFAPDGRTLATAGLDSTVRLWDLSGRRRVTALSVSHGHTDAISSVAFAPRGPLLATAGLDRTVRLWDITDRRAPVALAALSGHADRVYSAAFSRSGGHLVTSGEDRTVRLWQVDLEQVAGRVCDLSFPRIAAPEWSRHFADLAYRPPC
ncbi:hypothetical protein [Nonomuraea jiangxiensis]|uniref:WD40 repeat n=1 Tax=Nonomuraea jiangxiensis TaxID=633440 RepID=A0A1G8QR98_9ACTN|nr:hypothetical protein [Nonomuraea jiangxiensis]SDJ07226.1 WD40 repeat [Nonomuraea jiangxiensis]